jgi:hypothetical protein
VTVFDFNASLDDARRKLADEGVLRLSTVKPKQVREEVVLRLRSEGFEVTRSVVRRPLAAQLSAALAHGATLSLKSIGSHVQGATAPEVKRTALGLVAQGKAHRVLRGTADTLAASDLLVASREELKTLRSILDGMSKNIARALRDRGGMTLLRADVKDALEKAWPEVTNGIFAKSRDNPSTRARGGAQVVAASPIERILAAVDATRDARSGLSFVPDIAKWIGTTMNAASARDALMLAASRGLLELRPEGGLNRLSEAELALCPPGPQGTRLSWVRRLDGEGK